MVLKGCTSQRFDFVMVGPNSLCHLFRILRRNRNLTSKALAEKCKVSEDFVLRIENGSIRPPLKYWLSCAEIFGVNPKWCRVKWSNEMSIIFKRRLEEKIIDGGDSL